MIGKRHCISVIWSIENMDQDTEKWRWTKFSPFPPVTCDLGNHWSSSNLETQASAGRRLPSSNGLTDGGWYSCSKKMMAIFRYQTFSNQDHLSLGRRNTTEILSSQLATTASTRFHPLRSTGIGDDRHQPKRGCASSATFWGSNFLAEQRRDGRDGRIFGRKFRRFGQFMWKNQRKV